MPKQPICRTVIPYLTATNRRERTQFWRIMCRKLNVLKYNGSTVIKHSTVERRGSHGNQDSNKVWCNRKTLIRP